MAMSVTLLQGTFYAPAGILMAMVRSVQAMGWSPELFFSG
jgi:hypothetical protein